MTPGRVPPPLNRGAPVPVAPSANSRRGSAAVCSALAPLGSLRSLRAAPGGLAPLGLRSRPGPLRPLAALARLGSLRSLGVAPGRLAYRRAACARRSPPPPPPVGPRCGVGGPGAGRARLGPRSVPGPAGLRVALGLRRAPWAVALCGAAGSPAPPAVPRRVPARRAPCGGAARSSRRGRLGGLRPLFRAAAPGVGVGALSWWRVVVAPWGRGPYQTSPQPSRVKTSGQGPPLTAGVGSGRTGVRRRPGPGRPERTTKHDGGAP